MVYPVIQQVSGIAASNLSVFGLSLKVVGGTCLERLVTLFYGLVYGQRQLGCVLRLNSFSESLEVEVLPVGLLYFQGCKSGLVKKSETLYS